MTAFATVLIHEERRNGKGISTKVVDQVLKVKGVADCFPAQGRCDAVAFLEAGSAEQVRAAALKLNAVPGIRATETLLSLG